jgi:hypothetical protein
VCVKLGIKDIITTSSEIYWRKGLSLAMHRCPVARDVILMMTAVTPFSCGPQLSSPPARKGTIKTTSPRCRGHLTAPATAIDWQYADTVYIPLHSSVCRILEETERAHMSN